MIRIGEFSRVSGVSIKALRLYDRMGLLKPTKIDKHTSYRYYSASQLEQLNRIVTMKDLGLSLRQIADLTKGDMSVENVKRIFSLKEAEIHERLIVEKRRLMQVEDWLRLIEKEGSGLLSFDAAKVLEELDDVLVKCDPIAAASVARKAIDLGLDFQSVFDTAANALNKVCKGFDSGDCWIPDLVGVADAMLHVLSVLKEVTKDSKSDLSSLGVVVIGTVDGDIHNIGKDMVSALLVANGFQVYDLGVDVKTEDFIKAIGMYNADILAMSALLSSTAPQQKRVITALKEAGIRDRVKVMVGGGAVNEPFAMKVGADGHDSTAPGAVRLAKRLMG